MGVIHIRWTSTRKSATLRTIVLALFHYRLMKHYTFSITFKSEILLGQSKTPTASRRSMSLVFAVCGVHGSIVHGHGWSCNGWLSRCGTGEDRVEIPSSGHVCPGSRPMAAYNYGKGTTTPWRKRLRRHVVAGHKQMEMFKRTFLTPSGFAL